MLKMLREFVTLKWILFINKKQAKISAMYLYKLKDVVSVK